MKIKPYVYQLFLRQILGGVLFFLLWSLFFKTLSVSLLWGLLAGWGDNFFVLRGISKGMKKNMQEAAQVMHGTMLSRIALLLLAVVLGLHLGLTAYGVFGGYIFLHLLLIGNMILLAKNKPARE